MGGWVGTIPPGIEIMPMRHRQHAVSQNTISKIKLQITNNKTKTTMTYLERFKTCGRCPVNKYCGTMVSTMRLCNSYRGEEDKQQTEKTK